MFFFNFPIFPQRKLKLISGQTAWLPPYDLILVETKHKLHIWKLVNLQSCKLVKSELLIDQMTKRAFSWHFSDFIKNTTNQNKLTNYLPVLPTQTPLDSLLPPCQLTTIEWQRVDFLLIFFRKIKQIRTIWRIFRQCNTLRRHRTAFCLPAN